MLKNNMLNVLSKAVFDNSITRFEIHTHQPYIASALGPNDEIRLPIQQQDIYTNVQDSFIFLEGKVIKGKKENNEVVETKLVTNAFAHLFEEIRYELNGQVIDKCRNVGIASTMKGYITFNETEAKTYWNYGADQMDTAGNFCVCLPVKTLLGFCEHYDKIIINAKHELVLLRSKNDDAVFISPTAKIAPKIELSKVHWLVPHVQVSDVEKIELLKIVDSKKDLIIPIRSWDIYECPMLSTTTKQSWTIKTTAHTEKPRYIIVGFQEDRKNYIKDSSKFDNCNIINVKLFLNSEIYPYDNLNINFKRNNFEILYYMYANFQPSYLKRQPMPLFDRENFKNIAPLVVIDCSKQVESVKSSQVDVRLEIESNEIFKQSTVAFALIIHDRIIEYNPYSSIVKVLV